MSWRKLVLKKPFLLPELVVSLYGQLISKGFYSCEEELVTENYISENQLEFVVTQHEDLLILFAMYYANDKNENLAPNIDNGTKTMEKKLV